MEIVRTDKSFKRNGMVFNNIMTIKIGEYIIYIFPGALSANDILIKYSKNNGRLRTPKHIHWVADLLMKIQADKKLTRLFIEILQIVWNKVKPLRERTFESIKDALDDDAIDLNKYKMINMYGEYPVEFLYILIKLLAIQEKSNRSDAYMFSQIINSLLEDKLDIFSIVSKAGYNGR